MQQLSPSGQQAVNDIAQRHGFSPDAVASMLEAVVHGRGGMAQFNHPAFGGGGQWMRGGMTMVSDMFNTELKGRVDALCNQLSELVAVQPDLIQGGSFQSQSQGAAVHQGGQSAANLFAPASSGGGQWWPGELGAPNSTGGQNDVQYAYFAQPRRLAIERGGQVTVYDTQDHQIGGVSQQQSRRGSVSFTSQHGLVDIDSLPVVSGAAGSSAPRQQPPAAAPAPQGAGESDVFTAIEKLAGLHARGFISEDEFRAKKAELLARL